MNVMQQNLCLVFDPVAVDDYAFLFNCSTWGRVSDSNEGFKLKFYPWLAPDALSLIGQL